VDGKGLEVLILFAAKIGDGKAPDSVLIFRITCGGSLLILGSNAVAAQVGVSHFPDIVAAVTVLGPAVVLWADAPTAGLHRQRQVGDLLACIVVVELAGDIPPGCCQQSAQGVAHRRAAPMTYV